MAERITQSELARRLGVHPSQISRAVSAGRVDAGADGLVDAVGATAQFEANRQRRRRRASRGEAAPPAATADYWQAKAEREVAEASMATMREAEMRGDLVRRAEIQFEFAARLIALREALETLADRLAALVAAESDIRACRLMLRDEHRAALAAFTAAHNHPGEQHENP